MTPDGKARLIADEGKRNHLYNDKTGEDIKKLADGGNATIGVGRNLSSRPFTDAEVDYLFNNDVNSCQSDIIKLLPWITGISSVRFDVVVMVEFNTGNVFAFKKMLVALHANDWKTAALELMDSAAARQLPERYGRMRDALLTGSWKPNVDLPAAPHMPSTGPLTFAPMPVLSGPFNTDTGFITQASTLADDTPEWASSPPKKNK